MAVQSRMYRFTAVMAMAGIISACGGGGSSSTNFVQTGKLVQGPVSGARVFADRTESGTRFVEDGGEIVAVTAADGSYTLPTTPNYSYILVSQGGVDTLAKDSNGNYMPAMQMLAPSSAKNITPLTTLAVLDQTNTAYSPTMGVISKIEAMLPAGTKYDTNISENSSPAALLLAKSIEAATSSLCAGIQQKSSNLISAKQYAYLQAVTMQAIAQTIASDTSDPRSTLATPSALQSLLHTAVDTAITNINNANMGVSVPTQNQASFALQIASDAVIASTNLLGATSNAALPSGVITKETALMAALTTFANAVAGSVSAVISSTITAVYTPDSSVNTNNIPVNIGSLPPSVTGASGSTGSSGTGTAI